MQPYEKLEPTQAMMGAHKKPITEFNGCYTRITKVHQNGMSDDQKMGQATQLYASEHSDKHFTMYGEYYAMRTSGLHMRRNLARKGRRVQVLTQEKEKEKSTSTIRQPQ